MRHPIDVVAEPGCNPIGLVLDTVKYPGLKAEASRVVGAMADRIAAVPTRGPSPNAPTGHSSKRSLIPDQRRIVIASRHKTTRAAMYAHTEVLGDRVAARCTFLRTASRRELDHLGAGTFRLAREDSNPLRPASVVNRLGQKPTGHARDVELFDRNTIVLAYELACFLVVKVAALVAYVAMRCRQPNDGLAPTLGTLVLLVDLSRGKLDVLLCLAIEARVGDIGVVVQNREVFQADVQGTAAACLLSFFHRDFVAGKHHVPVVAFALERCGLRAAGHLPVPNGLDLSRNAVDFETTALGEIDSTAMQVALVVDLRERERVVPALASEPREARFLGFATLHSRELGFFDTTKEAIEGTVHALDDVLQDL